MAMGTQTQPATFSDLNRHIASFQLRISYQVGYNHLIIFLSFWRLSSLTSSKQNPPGPDFWRDRIHCDTNWKNTNLEANPTGIFSAVECRSFQRRDTCPVDLQQSSMGAISNFSLFCAKPGGHWPPQHVNSEVGGANHLDV